MDEEVVVALFGLLAKGAKPTIVPPPLPQPIRRPKPILKDKPCMVLRFWGRPSFPHEHIFRKAMKMKILGLAALERSMLRQRSRFLWLKEGDCNSKFFHIKASARRRKSFIPSTTVGDVTTVDQEMKKQAIWQHFNNLIGTYQPSFNSINLAALQFPEINLQSLSSPILEDEVKAAVMEMHPEKAPVPDGFTGLFYRVAWDIIKEDVMKAIKLLENAGTQGLHLLNNALMVLLPKSSEAASPGDYRPISLVHSFGKLFTKILAKRLQP
jgi:hypothetical protein